MTLNIKACRIVLFILTVLVYCSCRGFKSYEEDLGTICSNASEKCPQMLDSETRLEEMRYLGQNTVEYVFTLVNLPSERKDSVEFKKLVWPGILSLVKVNYDLKKLREHRTTVVYTYQDSNRRYFCRVVVRPEDYEN